MEIPYEVTPRRDTGLFNAKLGIWLFLASEVMLFGGLFSGYVFLRVSVQDGVDNAWPWGLNVHKNFVYLGFVNTLVLILSSVWVVFAWVSLKERNWRKFQLYMYGVVACAAIFMCVKTVEYNSKLNHHHGIKLVDNSVLEGTIIDKTDRISFEAEKISFSLQGGLPAFLKDLDDGEEPPVFAVEGAWGQDEDGKPLELTGRGGVKSWFLKTRPKVARKLAEERSRYRKELAADPATAKPVAVETSATLVAKKPFHINANNRKVVKHSETNVAYKDGSGVEGKLLRDDVEFELHEVDMQLVLPQNQRDSVAWEVIGDEKAKEMFFSEQAVDYEHLEEYYGKRGKPIPEKMLRGYILNLQPVHLGGLHGEDLHEKHLLKENEDHGDATVHTSEQVPAASEEGHGEDHGSHGGHGETITVPRDKIKFMSAHSPRYGNYYAIYFTMTALHGLHVVGGALVLLYMVVFGKKLYLKNPEHLANRVEVGGLFWHFVDLIWIFLFPLFYLL